MIDEKAQLERCECTILHQDIVDYARRNMLEHNTTYQLADFFKVLGDATRIKILNSLFISEMCVCDISALLEMNQSAISHQLRVLKQSRLVKYRKEGKVVFYSLDDEHIKQILDQGLIHVREDRG